jgi:predicted TIM-barrel fold metal-dependent hydrolase
MLELNHGFRVADVDAWLPGRGAVAEEAAESLEREMHQAGVVRAAVSPGPHGDPVPGGDYLRANNAVARGTVERPLVALARVSGPREPGGGAATRLRNAASRRGDEHTSPAAVEEYAYDDRFHGFTLHPPVDGLPDEETLAAMGDVGAPVLVHAGASVPPAEAARPLLGHGFPVVLAHFGGYPLEESLMEQGVAMLADHDDLYLDTSAVRYRSVLESALREHPDRVLFGSGAPTVHPSVGVMEILTLDVPEDAMRRVFSKNAARVVAGLGPAG